MTNIADLDPDVPSDNASAGAGASEIRGVKEALKTSLGGLNQPVKYGIAGAPVTSAQLTALFDRVAAVETLAAAAGVLVPGMTMFWPYTFASIPTGWTWANGATVNGFATRDMRLRMAIGTDEGYILSGDVGGSTAVITTSSSGGVSAGTTGNTSLTASQIPNISSSLRIALGDSTSNSSDNHNSATQVARSATNTGAEASLLTGVGLNGDPHTHTTPAIAAHTHTLQPALPPYVGGYWITYVGVA